MIVRRYKPEDAAKIDEIYTRCHGHFQMPDIAHCLELAVVEVDGVIVAFGAFELIPELTLVLDNERPKREQVAVLKELLDTGALVAKLNHFDKMYVFPDSYEYSGILQKHFDFEPTDNPILKRVID